MECDSIIRTILTTSLKGFPKIENMYKINEITEITQIFEILQKQKVFFLSPTKLQKPSTL